MLAGSKHSGKSSYINMQGIILTTIF